MTYLHRGSRSSGNTNAAFGLYEVLIMSPGCLPGIRYPGRERKVEHTDYKNSTIILILHQTEDQVTMRFPSSRIAEIKIKGAPFIVN